MAKKDFHQIREARKIGLQTFFLNLENNNYDSIINKLILQLKIQLDGLNIKKQNLKNEELSRCAMDIYFLERELLAIAEMKIIYAFKNFETHLVWLLKASYGLESNKKIYKWETIKDFLLTKNIDPCSINNYQEINQLRGLNNSIKHSIKAKPSDLKNIREFQNKDTLNYQDFLDFYNRIGDSIINFISSLSEKIELDLYKFDNNRLSNLSDSFKERMDKVTLAKFISKLNS